MAILGGLIVLQLLAPAAAVTAGSITDACPCWVNASSGPKLAFSLTLHNNSQGTNWSSSVVWANLTFTNVTGFNASNDLAPLTATAASGVAFYNESGAAGGFQAAQDVLVGAPTPALWFESPSGTYRANFTFGSSLKLRAFTAATNIYVVMRTSGTVNNGDRWTAGLGINQLNATWGNFPAGAFTSANITADTIAPTSSVTPISPYWRNTSPLTVDATASDAGSGVANTDLYYNYSADNSSFAAPVFFGTDTTAPYSFLFPFPNGQGHYRFFSRANDTAGNSEAAPGSADAMAANDTAAPASSVSSISGYWKTSSPLTVPWSATDNFKLANVTLEYRYRADNASSFGPWTFFTANTTVTGTAAAGNYSFTYPNGTGHYQFRTIAKDAATNAEAGGGEDELVGFDNVPPVTSADAISPYWSNLDPRTFTATGSDAPSGIAAVDLWYRYSPDNGSWGSWVFDSTDASSPYSFIFAFADGPGYYEFYTRGNDTAGNIEGAPGAADARAGFDNIAPVSSVPPNTQYWRNANVTIPADATDPLSGVAKVDLYYRFRATNSSSWGNWTFHSSDTNSPYEFPFSWPNGQGHYEVYSRSNDTAGNSEGVPGTADASAAFDNTAPTSSVGAIAGYWKTSSPLTVPWSATDNFELRNVTLEYRYRLNNASSFGGWTFFASNTTVSGMSAAGNFTFTYPMGNGIYELRTVARDAATNAETGGSADEFVGYDNTPPTTSVGAIAPYWKNAGPVTLTATASDTVSGVTEVSLWYRFSTDNISFGPWTLFLLDTTAPYTYSFTFPNAQGYYEFYTIGNDTAVNSEAAPGAKDALAGFDTTPASSSASTVTPYWRNTSPATITATATDALSGATEVGLWYRFAAVNGSFGSWTLFAVDGVAPYNYLFTFPGGQGYYEFYTIANDTATNSEPPPGARDSLAGYDFSPPTSSVTALSPYWGTASPRILSATATDALSGVARVSLWYRYSPDNLTFGSWSFFGFDATTPFTFDFSFPGGQGYYEFYSVANDTATNSEAAPGSRDTLSGHDTTAPSSSVSAISSYWGNTSPRTITATAGDALSGVSQVGLYYRYSTDNVSFGTWTFFGLDTTGPYTFGFTFPGGQGYYEFYTIANDTATNSETAPGARDALAGYDTTAPASSVSTIAPYWKNTSPATIDATASDALSGVARVSLWYRYSTDNVTFGSWVFFGFDGSSPYSFPFSFPAGQGYYEFRSIANDTATNSEAPPVTRDAIAGYDSTAPTSSVNALSPYWRNVNPIPVTATASDSLSGIATVNLFYRHAPDNSTWSSWTLFSSDSTSPYSWNFTWPSGEGYYEFYTYARDRADNAESAPATRDTLSGFDTSPPATSVNALSPYWGNASPRAIPATASDGLSGVTGVTLWYRYATNNVSFGSWTSFGTDTTAPYSFNFNFPGGQGHYEFYTTGTDLAGNSEAAPASRDALAGYDTTRPASTADTVSPYWRNASPATINVTASDALSGVASVTLWYRYSADNATFGAWTSFGTDTTSPYSFAFTFPGSQGYYEFRSIATDVATNVELAPASRDTLAGYDITAPTSSVDAIVPYWRTTSPITITATAADGLSGLLQVQLQFRYSGDNATFGAWTAFATDAAAPWSFSFTFPSGQGYYQFRTVATDRAQNAETPPATPDDDTGYDFTVPASSVSTLSAYWYTVTPAAIPWTATDNLQLFSVRLDYRYRATNASSWGAWTAFATSSGLSGTSASGSFSFTFPAGQGFYQLRTVAVDRASNAETAGAEDEELGYDVTAPTSTPSVTGFWQNTSPIPVNWTATDTVELRSVRLEYRFRPGATGSYGPWFTFATDAASGTSDSGTFDFTWPDGEGYYQFRAIGTDAAGNVEAAGTSEAAAAYDATRPTSNVLLLPSFTTVSVFTITADANDDLSGVTYVELFYRKDLGTWTLYSIDTAGPWTWSFDSGTTGGDGRYDFFSRATDTAQNLESQPFAADTTTIIDTTPPTSSMTAVSPYWRTTSPLSLAWAASDNLDLDRITLEYRFRVDNLTGFGAWTIYAADASPTGTSSSGSFIFSFPNGEGHYELRTQAQDSAGNLEAVGAADVRLGYDATAPVTVVTALSTYQNTRTFTVSVSVTEAISGTVELTLHYRKDGGTWGPYATRTTSPWSFTFDTATTGGDGFYEFATTSRDLAGNVETLPSLRDAFTSVDRTAPVSSADDLAAFSNQATITVTAVASDSFSGVASVDLIYRKDGGSWTTFGTDTTPAFSWSVDTSLLGGNGLYEFYTVARDAAGNAEAKAGVPEASITVDTLAPTSSPFPLPTYSGTTIVPVTATATDGLAGISSVTLYFRHDAGSWTEYGPVTAFPYSWSLDTSLLGGDGLYEFYTVATDAAGNLEGKVPGAEAQTLVDTVAPTSSTDPVGAFATGPFTVTATASDASSGVARVDLYFNRDGGAWTVLGEDLASPYSFAIDPSTLGGDGLYAFYAVARDAAGNLELKSPTLEASIRVDTVAPTSVVSPLPSFTITDPALIVAGASDGGSGVASVQLFYRLDAGPWISVGNDTALPYAWSFSSGASGGDGRYDFYVLARDAAGNVEMKFASVEATTLVDTTPPTAIVDGLAPFTATRLFTLTATVPADLAGVTSVALLYRRDGGSWATYSEDSVAPWAWAFDSALTGGDGLYEFRTEGRDAAGNLETASTSSEASTRIDTIPPSSSLSPLPTFQTNLTFTVDGSTSDSGSGIYGVTLYARTGTLGWSSYGLRLSAPWTWTFNATGDGIYEFYVVAQDIAGNVEAKSAVAEARTTVDTTPPTSLVLNLAALQPTETFAIAASVTDATSGPATAELFYRHDGGPWASYGVDVGAPFQWIFDTTGTGRSGLYEFYAIGTDVVGHVEAKSPAVEASTLVDTTPPSSSADALSAYTRVTSFTVTAAAIDLESGLASVKLFYSKDGGPWSVYGAASAAPWSWVFDTAVTGGDGRYEFRTIATDLAGGEEIAPATPDTSTRVDTRAPVTSSVVTGTFGNGGWYVSLVTVSLAASDDASGSGIGTIEYRVDGGGWTTYLGTFAITVDGRHTIEYRSADVAGNAEADRRLDVAVDATPPTSSVGPMLPDSTTSILSVNFTATDTGSGIAAIELWVDMGSGFVLQGTFAAGPVTFTAIRDGAHAFYTVARDFAGNVEAPPTSADATTRVDTTPPVTTIDRIPPLWTASSTWTFNLTATDATSGVCSTQYRIDGLDWKATVNPVSVIEPEGMHELAIRSTDCAGNVEAGRTYLFGIDGTPPAATTTTVPRTTERLIEVHFTATDVGSGVAGVELWVSLDGGAFVRVGTGLYTSGPVPYLATGLGVYTFRANALDNAGNVDSGTNGESFTEVVEVEVVPPPPTDDTANAVLLSTQATMNTLLIMIGALLGLVAALLVVLALMGRRRKPSPSERPVAKLPPDEDDEPSSMPLEYYDRVEEVPDEEISVDDLPPPEDEKKA